MLLPFYYFYFFSSIKIYVTVRLVINLKILFKNTTKYSKENYKIFLQFHSNQFRFRSILYTATIIGLLLFCIILQVKSHNLTLAITFCMIFTIFFLWRYLHPISEISKEFSSEKIQNEKQFTFIFYEKYLKIQDKTFYQILKYHKLYKIFETPYFFYLYLDKTHSLLLDKSSFSIGSSEEFSAFIHKKCWYQFKKVKSFSK